MKNLKKIVALALAGGIAFNTVSTATAQSMTYKELIEKSAMASQAITTVDVEFDGSIALDQSGQKLNVAQAHVKGEVDFINMNGKVDFNLQQLLAGQNISGEAAVKDAQVAAKINGELQAAEGIQSYVDMTRGVLASIALANAQTQVTAEQEAAMTKYFDVKEMDGDYVLALKQGIDGNAFYTDNKAAIEALKQSTYKQIEDRGEEVTAETRQQVETLLSQESFAKFFASNPVFEMHYDGQSFLMEEVKANVIINPADYGVQSVPGNINLSMELDLSDYNEAVNVTLPN